MLVVTPYYNKPNPAGIRAHVEAIAAATEKPIVLYNIPSRTVINVPPEELAELAEIDNVVAVKQANDDELRADRGTRGTGRQRQRLPPLPRARRDRRHLVASHLVGPQMAEIRDLFEAGERERPGRSTRPCSRSTRRWRSPPTRCR